MIIVYPSNQEQPQQNNKTKNYRPGMNAMDLYYTVLQVIRMCILLKPCYKFKLLIINLTNPLSDFLLNRLLMRIISCKSAKNGWALKITKHDGMMVICYRKNKLSFFLLMG